MSQEMMNSIGADGVFTADFAGATRTHLGEGYADSKALDDVHDIGTLAKIAVDGRSKITKLEEAAKNTISKPGETATDEEKAAYSKSLSKELGASDNADDYIFGKPENLPEGLPYNEEGAKKWAEFFRDNDVPVKVAQVLVKALTDEGVNAYNTRAQTQQTEFETAAKAITDTMSVDDIGIMGRRAYQYLQNWGSDAAKEAVKGMNESASDLAAWNKVGVPPAQVVHMAQVAESLESGTHKTGDGGNLQTAEQQEKNFIDSVNSKSPALQSAK